ncbi:MAG: hypothetical protein LBR13_04420 [Dysgonamonadaceae bacterium]|jgi:hypothetical protein|nr:hypothetical protein [Dysgonamonadaceae bacterium]
MKKILLFFGTIALFAIVLMSSDTAYKYGNYVPVFMDRADLEKSVKFVAERRMLITPGKIYYKSPYVYINERYKGIHIIDNTDPKNPRNVGFITAPGCIDIAAKGNILYLDNSVDLVAFDLITLKEIERVRDVFPEPISPEKISFLGGERPTPYSVIVEWKKIGEE